MYSQWGSYHSACSDIIICLKYESMLIEGSTIKVSSLEK